MTLLGIDIGSSSVKAGLLRNGRVVGDVTRAKFKTRYDGTRAEVDAREILNAVSRATRELHRHRRDVDLVALSTMSPAWVAMDARGKAITPIVTHQDRRSVELARQIEEAVGRQRHLKLAGNRPFPGGISSTTCAWFVQHEREGMRRADLVGHLNAFLHRQLTGARVTDPSNASFMGLYRTLTLGGWSEELCDVVGISRDRLPDVRDANEIGGKLTKQGARVLGLREGTPMLVGLTDASAAMLLAGARPGQLLNVSGSTDVLALCTDRPRPHERLLTRALGVGRRWLSVSTLAAAGSAFSWIKEQLFHDVSWPQFKRLMDRVARESLKHPSSSNLIFEPYLAGDRTSLEQCTGELRGLTLATTREDILAALVDALARASAERLRLLREANVVSIRREVVVSGGAGGRSGNPLQRDWDRRWTFRHEKDATLRGLARLVSG